MSGSCAVRGRVPMVREAQQRYGDVKAGWDCGRHDMACSSPPKRQKMYDGVQLSWPLSSPRS